MNFTVNNVMRDKKRNVAGSTDRHVWGSTISWQNRLTMYGALRL